MPEQKAKILIVDDDIINVEILNEILEDQYNLRAVYSGADAIQILDEFNPDLILLDIMMPGLNGYEVTEIIRKNTRHKLIKIILVSGKASIEDRLEGYRVGADDYITKPFDDEELFAKIKVFLNLKRVEEVDEIKSRLIGLFSHEARTPLNGIIVPAQFILNEINISEDVKEYAGMILENSYALLDFVKKTTLLCELKTNSMIQKTDNDLILILKSLLHSLKEQFNKFKIKYDLITSENQVILNCDWNLMNEALKSVIDNSIKYGGKDSLLKIALKKEGNKVKISFIDEGPGIPPENVNSIFEEFNVSDLMGHHKGLGLSLSIARQIINLHHGYIGIDIQHKSGAKVDIELPL